MHFHWGVLVAVSVSFAEVSKGTALIISGKGRLTAVIMMWFKWLTQMADWAIVDSV